VIRELGLTPYATAWQAMRDFTESRTADTADELWLCEHLPVYTQGLAGKPEHLLLNPSNIPVVQSDRGGQITYHGPGQIVLYCLLDLRRHFKAVRPLVRALEQTVIDTLADYHVAALAREDAPGVYVEGRKIASLGLKIRKHCSYHGIALNVAMDLSPFAHINPCGAAGLEVTQLRDLGITLTPLAAGHKLARHLQRHLDERPTP
jgi:lipoyl(octanoyl) transferase